MPSSQRPRGLGRAGPCPRLAAAAAHKPGSKFKASALTGDLWLPGKPTPPPAAPTKGLARSLGGTRFGPVTFCLRVTPQTGKMAREEALVTPGPCDGASVLPASALLDSGSLPAGPFSLGQKQFYGYYCSPHYHTITERLMGLGLGATCGQMRSVNKWVVSTLHWEAAVRTEMRRTLWASRRWLWARDGLEPQPERDAGNPGCAFSSSRLYFPPGQQHQLLLLSGGRSAPQATWQTVAPAASGLSSSHLHRHNSFPWASGPKS